jgi:WD40 repeat protein
VDADVDKMLVKKARFIDDSKILLGLMCNELILFDIEKKKVIFNLSISSYTFSDFDVSEDKQFAFTSDESGIVHKIDIQQGKIVKEFSGNNVDNVYKLVYQNGKIITAGQDRRVGVYNTLVENQYYLQKNFLVYSVGLNEEATLGAFTADEENNIILFDIASKLEISKLSGHQSVITKMEFVGNSTLVSAADDQFLMIWEISKQSSNN